MKRFLLAFFLTNLVVALNGQDASAIVKFEQEVIHLGKVKDKEKVKEKFVFTNISQEDVKIDIVSTCDCTEAKWTSGIISPGDTGVIDFIFDSSKKEVVEPVDVDVYFVNTNPSTGNPYSIYLQYTFEY